MVYTHHIRVIFEFFCYTEVVGNSMLWSMVFQYTAYGVPLPLKWLNGIDPFCHETIRLDDDALWIMYISLIISFQIELNVI